MMLKTGESHRADQFTRAVFTCHLWHAPQFETKGDISQHVRPGQQCEILKDHCPVWPWCINTHAINADLALIERNETCYDLQDRRLAATTGPKQADKFPRVHHQFQAVKRDERRLLILTRIQLP